MAALSASVVQKTRPSAGRDSFKIRDNEVIYEGGLVGLDATTGLVEAWADGASDVFCGLALGGDDRAGDGVLTGEISDAHPPEARVDTSGVVLMHLDSVAGQGALAEADQGALVYCGTDNTDDLTIVSSGRNHPIGFILRFRSTTDVDVKLFSMAEHLAQANA